MRELIVGFILFIAIYIVMSCSGGGGGIGPIPTFDTTTSTLPTTSFTTFPTTSFTTTFTTLPSTSSTTISPSSYKYLYVKVLRKVNGNIQWLGSYEWNDYAYVRFSANTYSNSKTVYVNDGYWGTYTKFYYDRYTVDYVEVGLYTYTYGHYKVYLGDSYYTSDEAWYGQFYVNSYTPSSVYIVFQEGVTSRILGRRKR